MLFQYVYVRKYLRTGVEIEKSAPSNKFRIYLLFVAKRRLLISEIQGPQSLTEIWTI